MWVGANEKIINVTDVEGDRSARNESAQKQPRRGVSNFKRFIWLPLEKSIFARPFFRLELANQNNNACDGRVHVVRDG